MDHSALSALKTSTHLTGRLSRWALELQQFEFELVYTPGKTLTNADALSRRTYDQQETQHEVHSISTASQPCVEYTLQYDTVSPPSHNVNTLQTTNDPAVQTAINPLLAMITATDTYDA